MTSQKNQTFLDVPMEQISQQALDGLIEEFILREGTDYGHKDLTIDEKKIIVYSQLKAGFAKVVFRPEEESTTIIRCDK